MFTANPMPATHSGVRVSCRPRSRPGRGEDHEHGGQAGHRDREVHGCLGGDVGSTAPNTPDEHGGGEPPRDGEHDAEPERQPEPVDAGRHRAAAVAGAHASRHRGRRRVGEEHHEPDDRLQDRAREPEPRERRRPEVADHRGVGEQEQRLGDQRPERGHGEPQDVAVDGTGCNGLAHGVSSLCAAADRRALAPLAYVGTSAPR